MSEQADEQTVRKHHQEIADAVAPLGEVARNPTLLVDDKMGWYETRENQTGEPQEIAEWPDERRARDFTRDYEHVAANRVDRTLYALTSYKIPDALDRWEPARYDSGERSYDYKGRKPSPLDGDIVAASAWVDADLRDDLKPLRGSGELTYENDEENVLARAEEGYGLLADAFAELYGSEVPVFGLDSVGGAYVIGAPAATLPIARHFSDDRDARGRVMREFIERSSAWLRDRYGALLDEHEHGEAIRDVLDPDWANNINRQYKIPGTIHADHDAVVTPLDVTGRPKYRAPTRLGDVDDQLVTEIAEWCDEFTDEAFASDMTVSPLIQTLWSDYFETIGVETWQDALDAWVTNERRRELREQAERERAAERREERLEEIGDRLDRAPAGVSITPFRQDVFDALDQVDVGEVVRDYASDAYDTGGRGVTEFNPSWRDSDSGASCYINHEGNRFGDPGEGGGGYPAKAMALGREIIDHPADDLTGQDWHEAVDALREAGYDIPYWIPERGSQKPSGGTFDETPYWAVIEAAELLDVIPDGAAINLRENDDGSTYETIDATYHDKTLIRLATLGIDHNREKQAGPELSLQSAEKSRETDGGTDTGEPPAGGDNDDTDDAGGGSGGTVSADETESEESADGGDGGGGGDPPDPPNGGGAGDDDDEDDAESSSEASAGADPESYTGEEWEQIRAYYADEETSTKAARYLCVRELQSRHDFATRESNDELLIYDPETGTFGEARTKLPGIVQRAIGRNYSTTELREIEAHLRAETYTDDDDFDGGRMDGEWLCVSNGVLSLEDRELYDHSPAFLFTQALDVKYDEHATAPAIDTFLDEITARQEDRDTMMEMLGNALLPHYDYESFMILFGEGGNGKSVYYDMVVKFLSKENVSSIELKKLTESDFAASSLVGKYANIAPDMQARKIDDAGLLKTLSGGDHINVEEKNEQDFEFQNRAKLMFGANRPPVINERSDAIKRRILPIRLPYRFRSDPDPDDDSEKQKRERTALISDLTTDFELSGLLNMALDGIDRLRDTREFSLPESPEERLEYYEQFSDPIKEFAVNCLTNTPGNSLPKASVYDAYKRFCQENDYTITSDNVFFGQLRQTTFAYDQFRPVIGGRQRPSLRHAAFTQAGEEYQDDTLQQSMDTAAAASDGDGAAVTSGGVDLLDVMADEQEESTNVQSAPQPVTAIADAKTQSGYVTLTAIAVNVRDGMSSNGPSAAGVFRDKTGVLDYLAWDDAYQDVIEKDQAYRIEDGRLGTDKDGVAQVEFVAGVTKIMPIQQGAGETDRDDPGENQTLDGERPDPVPLDDDADEEENEENDTEDAGADAADPGESADESDTDAEKLPQDELMSLIPQLTTLHKSRGEAGCPHDTLVEELLERGAGDQERAESAIDSALSRGTITPAPSAEDEYIR